MDGEPRVGLRKPRHLIKDVGGQNGGRVGSVEGVPVEECTVEQHANAVEAGAVVQRSPLGLLGSHEMRGTEGDRHLGQLRVMLDQLCTPEVDPNDDSLKRLVLADRDVGVLR